jgi:hypothetical protein
MAAMARVMAVEKPRQYSVPRTSLSMVLGMATTPKPMRPSSEAKASVPSPPMTTSCSRPSASRLRSTCPPRSWYSAVAPLFSTRVTGKARPARWGGRSLTREGLTRLVCSTVPPVRSMVRVLSRSRGRR